jgi:hypothetical protein
VEKRYQVFVSSTYADLQSERQEVIQALLELECIPAGMELFPAADEDQWTLIKDVINDCDYYLVIVAGRYGSIGPHGKSYTEMEYRYALEQGKPVIGFVHANPGTLPANRCETDASRIAQLADFSELVKKKSCRFWDSPSDLGSKVSRSLTKLIKKHPAVGWVRGDLVPNESAAQEILKLKNQLEAVQAQLSAASTEAPKGTEDFSQGDDLHEFTLNFDVQQDALFRTVSWVWPVEVSWNTVFAKMSPLMINEASENDLRNALSSLLEDVVVDGSIIDDIRAEKEIGTRSITNFRVSDNDFQTAKIQLRALGLITQSNKARSVKDTATYWTLTPYGDTVMTRIRALRRSEFNQPSKLAAR